MFEELQSLSEVNKKRLLVVGTIIIMAIVIGVWVTYFNSIIIGSSQPPAATVAAATSTPSPAIQIAVPASSPSAQANGPGLWQDVKNAFGWFANIFQRPSQYTIQPQSN